MGRKVGLAQNPFYHTTKVSSRGASRKTKQVPKGRERRFRIHGFFFPNTTERDTKVEQLNRVRINVFGYNSETQKINILYVSDRVNEEEPTVNVLLAHNNQSNGMFHYCLVKSLSALLSAQQQSTNKASRSLLREMFERLFSSACSTKAQGELRKSIKTPDEDRDAGEGKEHAEV